MQTRDSTNRENYHESLEIWPPPLGQAVSDFPFVIDPMSDLVKLGTWRRSETLVQSPFQAFYFVFTWLEVVTWTVS
jgi:hypothetical protein